MGEIADMHLDGTLCESCGTVFDDVIEGKEPPGHPRYCKDCQPECPRRKKSEAAMSTDTDNRLEYSQLTPEDIQKARKTIVITTEVNGQKYVEEFDASYGYVLIHGDGENTQCQRISCDSEIMVNGAFNLLNFIKQSDPALLMVVLTELAKSDMEEKKHERRAGRLSVVNTK